MTNEEMKIVKFKTMIDELYEKLGNTHGFKNNGKYVQPVKVLLDTEKEDPFVNIIINKDKRNFCICLDDGSMKRLIELSNDCSRCNGIGAPCSVAGQSIFFALIAMAINDDLYNEKLEIVSDAAYLMGFTEAMMEDWITGVKKFLLAEKIKVADMKTEEGKQFFSALADEVNA